VVFFSIVFSVVTAHSIWWFFSSGLNWVDSLQQYVTFLLAVGFAGLGFIISRGLAHRMQHKQPKAVALFIAAVFEFVEIGCCFAQAVVGIEKIAWLPGVQGWLHSVLSFLCYALLPVTPVFTVGLAWFEVNLDREKHGQEVLVGQPAQNVVPVNAKASAGGVPNVGQPAQPPAGASYAPSSSLQRSGGVGSPAASSIGTPYNAGYAPSSAAASKAPPPPYTTSQPQAGYPVMTPPEGQRSDQTIPFYQPGQPGPTPAQPPVVLVGR
jgi:hypothetical protein